MRSLTTTTVTPGPLARDPLLPSIEGLGRPDLVAASILASPFPASRTRILLGMALARLAQLGVATSRIDLSTLPAEAILGRAPSARVATAAARINSARIVLIATPIYRDAYSGLLKTFLDLFPGQSLRGKVALPIAAGATSAQEAAIDATLRPLLVSLGAVVSPRPIFATEAQLADPRSEALLTAAVDLAVDQAATLAAAVASGLASPVVVKGTQIERTAATAA